MIHFCFDIEIIFLFLSLQIKTDMAQFLGFLFFLFMAIAGFWGIIYFFSIIPFWLSGWFKMKSQEKKGELVLEKRPTLPEQEGMTLLYKRS